MAEPTTPVPAAGTPAAPSSPWTGAAHQPVLFGPEGRPPYAGRAVQTPGYTPWDRERWLPEPPKSSYRSDFERDRARVLHSAGLRRLGAKTQVVAPDVDDFSRTRLTHSLEVAQVGRELGRSLGCDPDLVDTACLSHDLGHPPFGHNGEKALDALSEDVGGFEGNAQTLRLLARLEQKKLFADGSSAGLNLTRAALDAACKYPWTREDAPLRPDGTRSRKFGVYEDDLPVFRWFRAGVPGTRTSMEAQVMDLADDISYSVHDVEDGVVNAVFQLKWLAIPEHRERVVETTRQWYLPHTDPAEVDAALARLEATDVWVSEMDGSRRALAAMKDMTSQLIGRFCSAAFDATRQVFGNEPLTRHGADVVVPEETETEIAVMKGIAAAYVMTAEQRQPLYARQREVLTELVALLDATGGHEFTPGHGYVTADALVDIGLLGRAYRVLDSVPLHEKTLRAYLREHLCPQLVGRDLVTVGDVVAERTVHLTRESLVRYAGASGDFNPIHYRDDVAASVGLPGVLAHGMLTMGAAVQPVVEAVHPAGDRVVHAAHGRDDHVVGDDLCAAVQRVIPGHARGRAGGVQRSRAQFRQVGKHGKQLVGDVLDRRAARVGAELTDGHGPAFVGGGVGRRGCRGPATSASTP